MIIYACGPIGYETAKRLYDEHYEELRERFPSFFMKQFDSIGEDALDCSVSAQEGILYSRQITEGGIYRALWEAGETLGCGMKVANCSIPVRQEVIEILELYSETPYECSSGGAVLLVSDREMDEVKCGGRQIPVFRIGVTTDGSARVLEDGDTVRYLTPPTRQDKDIADRKTK